MSPLVCLRCAVTTALTDADVARDAMLLDATELQRLRRFIAAEDQRDYAVSHALLRRTLTSEAPHIAPEEWLFEHTPSGKPYLPAMLAGTPPLRFSLSHTRGYVACIVSRDSDVGVDVECHTHAVDVDLLMPGVCSADEQAQLRTVTPSARTDRFLDFWTLKEAYVKARGMGITGALDQVSFDLRTPGTISASLPEKTGGHWWLALISPSTESHIGVAIATDSRTEPVLDAEIVDTSRLRTPLLPTRVSSSYRTVTACID
jgi:4'-phosphopantetheinyl transferase